MRQGLNGLLGLTLALAAASIAGCPGSSGGGGNRNENASPNRNDNAGANENANDNAAENDNDNFGVNDNAVENENDNGAANDNANDNVTDNGNDNAAANENDNIDDNENENENANVNDNSAAQGLPAENQRAAFQSQCAQNVITCTTSFPVAVIGTGFLPGQVVTTTPTGLRIEGLDGDGSELVQLVGSGSTADDNPNTPPDEPQIFYSWSFGATDPNRCTLAPGQEISTEANPQVLMQAGLHYIRLTVTNDLPPIDSVDAQECGTFENYQRQDFEEIEIEVID